ncbi:HECT-domain ubiquitin-transferase [Nitzschia inconspicua]|uniref:HECT-domain ubiquitin-transferase n=1 Tax=Nitzschia inconspicua TaxID=303405 RepID=A0A9K3L4Z7_9STRA|nr:HECT-domain ubiquitin-transferase [Nitzschia inconspicua]
MRSWFSGRRSDQSEGGSNVNGVGANSISGGSTVFRVIVPENVQPGEEFQVFAGSRIVRVRCPLDSRPGQSLQITVPAEPTPSPSNNSSSNSINDAPPETRQRNNNSFPPDSPNVRRIENSNPAAYMVDIPPDIQAGQQFPVTIQGQQLMVTCPPNARPGQSVRIVPPPAPTNLNRPPPDDSQIRQNPKRQASEEKTQLFEVEVPKGVQPGAPFALLAGGVRVLVTCPPNARPGQKIRFKLPLALTQKRSTEADSALTKIKLKYGDKDGWTRTVRATDLKFQWIRMDEKGDIDLNKRFNFEKSAYVRKLEFRSGVDPRIRSGILSLVPAAESVVDSKIKSASGQDLVTYSQLAEAQRMSFDEKVDWFQATCAKLCVEWNEGHMRMNVRREYLLGDSVDAVMSLSRRDLRKLWRFEFIGEAGIDAGGLAREWFELVCREIFDPDTGLWSYSASNQMSMTINPASQHYCEDHLVYYRFLGRVMGKAMFDRQLVNGHMVKHLYKHILGWPIQFKDLESIDDEYYGNLKQVQELAAQGHDVSMLSLDFTTTIEILGEKIVVPIVEGGEDIEVTNDNYPEFVEACLKYKLMGCVKEQLNELLLGFFDVIPEPLLTIFDFQELELLMCGLPTIDMEDWQLETEYSGEYENIGGAHQTVQWFWETLESWDAEMKARLLQFVTGTSGVPARGFGVLQGNDGSIRKFTIHGLSVEQCLYPRAHTCFNRLDLPLFDSKEELAEKLKLAVTMSSTGFDIE